MPDIDYDALAKQHGAISSGVDYDALAKQHGAVSAEAPKHWSDSLNLSNPVARGAVDFAEGAASGLANTVFQGGDLIRRATGMERVINNPDVQQAITAPDSMAGKAGKFVEQAAEFAVPGAAAAKATKAASLLGKMAAQAVVGGGVAAVQSGGDPVATGTSAALGAVGPAVGSVVRAAGNTKLPERLYQSALKPTWSMFKKDAGEMLKTGIEHEIPVSASGMDMLQSKINSIGQKITQGITGPAMAGRTVNAGKVLATLDDLENFYRNTAAPKQSLDIIQGLRDEFAQYHGVPMTLDVAQQLKVNTYQLLKQSYGEMKSAKIEGLKNIARGLKEQIEQVWPEVKGLNEEQSKLLGLDDALYRALWRIENHQMMGIGSGIAGTAGHAVMGGPGAVAGLLGKFVLDDPTIKSKIAIALAKSGTKNPPAAVAKGLSALKAMLQESANPSQPTAQLTPAMAQ